MAPTKPVLSLYQLSLARVTLSLKTVSEKLDVEDHHGNRETKQKLRSYYDYLPWVIQNNLINALLDATKDNVIVKRKNNEKIEEMYKIIPHTLQFIVNERTKILKIEHRCLMRLRCVSNKFINLLKSNIRETIVNCSNLQQLTLTYSN